MVLYTIRPYIKIELRIFDRACVAYEWSCHTVLARRVGLTDEEIHHIIDGPDASEWSPFDATLLRTVDELHKNAVISDATWGALVQCYSEQQLMDLVFTIGQYTLVSMVLNSLGVQLDPDTTGFPPTKIALNDQHILGVDRHVNIVALRE